MSTTKRERKDIIFKLIFKSAGLLTIFLLFGIFAMLIYNSISFFLQNSPIDFFTGNQWNPSHAKAQYGILPLLVSTGFVSLGAMIISIPIGILTAAYLSEFAPSKVQTILKPIIEMLASIPSVAIGFLGIVLVGPGLANLLGIQNGLNALKV
jgi:phosphate transport system permease protein